MHLPYPVATLQRLPWTNPGHRPYTGSFEDALNRYAGEIPLTPLNTLRQLVKEPAKNGRYVIIDRAGVQSPDGAHKYGDLRAMHFAEGQLLRAVLDTSMWPQGFSTGALVFQAAQYCICIPTICRNVSIVTPIAPRVAQPFDPRAVATVPEPSSIALVALAAGAAWFARRRMHKPRS